MLRPFLTLTAFIISTVPAVSHEFWIDPVAHQVDPDAQIVASLRVGQDYEGSAYSYIPRNFVRFDYVFEDATAAVPGELGDRPALTMDAPGDGLVTLVHATTDYLLTYTEWDKFVSFVEHKDAPEVLTEHAERGLPETGFKEAYSRYAKALVGVGRGAGADKEVGLLTEIVALENPYTGGGEDGLDVQLLYQGAPRGDAQIEIFEKSAEGAVVVSTVRTDSDGKATIPVQAGHRYMLDAVVLRRPGPDLFEASGAVWESLWANLTFEMPAP